MGSSSTAAEIDAAIFGDWPAKTWEFERIAKIDLGDPARVAISEMIFPPGYASRACRSTRRSI